MGKRTGKPRGAPKGNSNRLIHGRYSGATKARRRAVRARVAAARRAIAQALLWTEYGCERSRAGDTVT
ncbi:hypothetical protein GCM10008942_30480 [Rhizomicrobium electricum]|uniref:Uncharacterized protein n=1 Tax=Rhizomicrobium electricum TaxID=480070 RepID=A0ABN1F0T7_9PROT